jgi:hypothetical protein
LFLQGREMISRSSSWSPEFASGWARATLHLVEDADHSFKVPKRTGRSTEQVMAELADRILEWGTPLTV